MNRFAKFVSVEQGSEEWHKMRNERIGASDAPIIMGVSPWMTPYRLWQIKVGLEPPIKTTEAMRRGTELEPIVRNIHNTSTGDNFKPAVAFSSRYPWMMASLDGYDEKLGHILEIKCPGKEDHECARNGEIPKKYIYQILHQMVVTELDVVLYISYRNEFDIASVYITINHFSYDEIRDLIEKEEEFYKCMVNLTPPPFSDKDYIEKNDHMWKHYADQLVELKRNIKEIQKKEEYLKNKLFELSEGKNCRGYGVSVQHVSRKGVIKYDDIPELEGIDLEQYRAPCSIYPKIMILEEK